MADEAARPDESDDTSVDKSDASDETGKAPAGGRGRRPDDGDQPSAALRHLKRYGPFYGIAVVALLVLALLPAVGGDDDGDDNAATSGSGGGNGDGPWAPGSGDLVHGEGTTRGGVECDEGVVQNPFTPLSVPCLPEFEGDNGGETARGVTEDTITVVVRSFPTTANSEALDQETEDAGIASDEDTAEIRDEVFLPWFNENYELYGRQVEFVEYESQFGDSTAEALGQGREGACQDATRIAEEMDAFGVISADAGAVSAVFAECAAEEELVVFSGATNYPESFFEDLHPYVWSTTMSCNRIAEHSAAYIGRRLVGENAEFAGDPELQEQERLIGSYNPDNEGYSSCTDESREILQEEHGAEGTEPIRYSLDISQFSDQAARAVLQWKDDGVTTVILSADPISISYITEHAEAQDYHPEWIITGSAGNDTNTFGRDYNQDSVDGHLFGFSQISSSEAINGPESDPGRLHQEVTGEEILDGTTGGFFTLTNVFNLLQAAGPELTAENLAAGVQAMPQMGGDGRVIWHFGDEHTAVRDVREVYWDGSAPPDPTEDQDLEGAYVTTYDGRRFLPEEWPEETPPIYPDR